ncbi:MAG TPA: hypothetical protein P5519_03775 [Spirochaetia bacterium]|nr:hypothetical protein [Spirochaetales bacterium]HRS64989.1 hypothetical protein [Spirochaetia bacterium]HOT59226.1 hypothetical protein [Spirochaetales bacterium]HPD79672.1 hypothetical protein [Spirochaetales bacterium]HQG39481.1 hypothetical protein [Spirochaetales bacterium]
MPIKPIDLQAMYTQLTQVGKNEALAKSTGIVHAELQREIVSKKNEEKANEVHLPDDDIENNAAIKIDENTKSDSGLQEQKHKKEKEQETPEPEKSKLDIADDPDIGKNIDLLG